MTAAASGGPADGEPAEYVTLVAGPMDGYRVRVAGVAHINTNPAPNEDGDARVLYGPAEGHPDPGAAAEWVFEGYVG